MVGVHHPQHQDPQQQQRRGSVRQVSMGSIAGSIAGSSSSGMAPAGPAGPGPGPGPGPGLGPCQGQQQPQQPQPGSVMENGMEWVKTKLLLVLKTPLLTIKKQNTLSSLFTIDPQTGQFSFNTFVDPGMGASGQWQG